MTPVREQRQRAAARARLEQQMAERLEAAQQRRKRNAFIGGGLGLLLVAGLTIWGVSALTGGKKPAATPSAAAAPVTCQWVPDDPAQNPNLKDVGTPAANEARTGTQTMTITTNLGVIEVEMDVKKAPCTAASFTHLATKKFYDNSSCHRMVTEGFKILQCGGIGKEPGASGPTYKFAEENLPTDRNPTYERGMVAMANTGQPASTGSQFFLIDQDIPAPDPNNPSAGGLDAKYTIVGKITKGLDILDKVIKDGAVDDKGKAIGDGKPKTAVEIKSVTVGPVKP